MGCQRHQPIRSYPGFCQRICVRKTSAISTWKCSYEKLATHVHSWSTSGGPDFVCALAKREQHKMARARCRAQSCSVIIGQLLVNWCQLPMPWKLPGSSLQGLLATPDYPLFIITCRTSKNTCGMWVLRSKSRRSPETAVCDCATS